MNIKQRLREARWAWWLPAAFFIGICVLPSGAIEASPGQFLHPPVLVDPMGWPLFAMGLVLGAAAFTEKLRRRAFHVLLAGTSLSLLFGLALVAFQGGIGYYSWALGTDLGNRIFTNFQLEVLAFGVLPVDLLFAGGSFIVLWSRDFRPAPPEAPPEPGAFELPLPPPPVREPALAAPAAPEAPETAAAPAPAPETPAARPAQPPAPESPSARPSETPAPEAPAAGPVEAPAQEGPETGPAPPQPALTAGSPNTR